MNRFSYIFIALIFIFSQSNAQKGKNTYWVFFKDKGPKAETLLKTPEKFLSPYSILQKKKNNIVIDMRDVPVEKTYLKDLQKAGAKILMVSKWFNGAVVEYNKKTPDFKAMCTGVKSFHDARRVIFTNDEKQEICESEKITEQKENSQTTKLKYGNSKVQNLMLGIDYLHDKNIQGQGVRVMVCDGGFFGVDTSIAFKKVWDENRMIGYKDFTRQESSMFKEGDHGTAVLSTIVANVPGIMIGTAPEASILLARTEVNDSETHQEEYNWIAAAEWADSIGVDIIHSSLGYSEFDKGNEDFVYKNVDGKTSMITLAAKIAASKGIIVTNSAGNSGNKKWHYITSPCDADSILCIGAVTADGSRSSFSSFGPTYDGRIKPEVMAMGSLTYVYKKSGKNLSCSQGYGTSYSSPIIAGMVACLKQAHHNAQNYEVIKAMTVSGNQADKPDNSYGYGIPNSQKADSALTNFSVKSNFEAALGLKVSFDKNQVQFKGKLPESEDFEVTIFGVNGKQLFQSKKIKGNKIPLKKYDNIAVIVYIQTKGNVYSEVVVK